MTENVVKLALVQMGEGRRLNAHELLDAAKEYTFDRLMVIGQIEGEDDVYITGSANAGETLILMELAKLQIIGAA